MIRGRNVLKTLAIGGAALAGALICLSIDAHEREIPAPRLPRMTVPGSTSAASHPRPAPFAPRLGWRDADRRSMAVSLP